MSKLIMIPKTNTYPVLIEHFESLLWLIKAVSKDEVFTGMYKTIMVKDGICYATDGHRMHVYEQSDNLSLDYYLQDGRYKIESVNKKQIIFSVREDDDDFPDVERVLSYRAHKGIHSFAADDSSNNYSWFLYHVYRNATLFYEPYLKDAFMYGNLDFERTGYNQTSGLVFGNGHQIAMVMPLKL